MHRPGTDEYHEHYEGYVRLVPEGDLLGHLARQREEVLAFLAAIPEEKGDYRYAPGKWSVKEVVGHVLDTEWLFAFRALHFARSDPAPLPGVDQDATMAAAEFGSSSLADLRAQFGHLRSAVLLLFGGFSEEVSRRRGTASGRLFTVRAAAHILAGHVTHHLAVLRERYGFGDVR